MDKIYQPDTATPLNDVSELRTFVERELSKISIAFQQVLRNRVLYQTTAPDKLLDGMIVGADGNHWEPIANGGKGPYIYQDGSWQKLLPIIGSYTPTGTAMVNCTLGVVGEASYVRVANLVDVWGAVEVDPVAVGSVEVGLTLPFAADFSAVHTDTWGLCACAGVNQSGTVRGDVTNDRAHMIYVAADTILRTMVYNYRYRIVG